MVTHQEFGPKDDKQQSFLDVPLGYGIPHAIGPVSKCLGRVAVLLFERGGRLIVDATSRNGGIVVETESHTTRLLPLPQRDGSERALLKQFYDALTGGLSVIPSEPLDVNVRTYQELLASEAAIRQMETPPRADNTPLLFEHVAAFSPDAYESASTAICGISIRLFKHGGLLILQADGPSQGITIEAGEVSVSLGVRAFDQEDEMVRRIFSANLVSGRERDPLSLNITTLLELLSAEARLREDLD